MKLRLLLANVTFICGRELPVEFSFNMENCRKLFKALFGALF